MDNFWRTRSSDKARINLVSNIIQSWEAILIMQQLKIITSDGIQNTKTNQHYYKQFMVPMIIDAFKAQAKNTIEILAGLQTAHQSCYGQALMSIDSGLTHIGIELELTALIHQLEERLLSAWHHNLAEYYSPEFLFFRAEQLIKHDFCELFYSIEPETVINLHDYDNVTWYKIRLSNLEQISPDLTIQAINDVVNGMRSKHQRFQKEMFGHIPIVNRQVSHLYSVLTDLTNLLGQVKSIKQAHKGIFTLFGLGFAENIDVAQQLSKPFLLTYSMLLSASIDNHDFGKYAPPNKCGVNNYGAHPWVGYQQLKTFLENGNLIINSASIPSGLISPEGIAFTSTEVSQIITAITLHHLTSAGPGLGENGQEVNAELLLEPLLQTIYQDPIKRTWYFNLMTVVTICDIAALGFLSKEKLEFYLDTPQRLEGLFSQIQSGFLVLPVDAAGKLQYGLLDKTALYGAMGLSLEAESDRRLAGMLSANMATNVSQRETVFIMNLLEKGLSEVYKPSNMQKIKSHIHSYFNRVVKWEYGRNFLQAILLKPGVLTYNPEYNEDIMSLQNQADNIAFDAHGFAYLEQLINDVDIVTKQLRSQGINVPGSPFNLSDNAPLIVRTGQTNSQFNYHNFVQWKHKVASNQDWQNEFFEMNQSIFKRRWILVTYNKQYGTFHINYDFEGFMKSKGLFVSSI